MDFSISSLSHWLKPVLITSIVLVIILFCLLIIHTISYLYGTVKDFRILQSKVKDVTPGLLYRKYPIVVQDVFTKESVADRFLQDLMSRQAGFHRTIKNYKASDINSTMMKNRSKFTVVFNGDSTNVVIAKIQHPFPESQTQPSAEVLLKPGRMLILPAWWSLSIVSKKDEEKATTESPFVTLHLYDDCISRTIQYFSKK